MADRQRSSPKNRWMLEGAERADSLVLNPHKWLFTPVDCSVFYCRKPEMLRRAFSLVPEYLRTEQDDRAVNFMDYGFALGRRFRALKLWFIMRYFGRKKIEEILRYHIALAHELADAVRADKRFEVVAPTTLSLVCFRYRGTDDENKAIIERLNASGSPSSRQRARRPLCHPLRHRQHRDHARRCRRSLGKNPGSRGRDREPRTRAMSHADPSPVIDLIQAFRRSQTMFTAVSLGISICSKAGRRARKHSPR